MITPRRPDAEGEGYQQHRGYQRVSQETFTLALRTRTYLPAIIIPFIHICQVDGSEVPLDGLSSLQVKLCSAMCERQEPRGGFEGFPRRHTPEVHRSVTHGKVGGYGENDD